MSVGAQGGSHANPNAFAGDTINVNAKYNGDGPMVIGDITTGGTNQSPSAMTGPNAMTNSADLSGLSGMMGGGSGGMPEMPPMMVVLLI